jgi:predicted nucleic acid-binding protein
MNGKVFFDTNVLVYAHTDLDTAKQSIAQDLIFNKTNIYQHSGNPGTGQYPSQKI